MKLYYLSYNNYYNRILKKLDTIQEYIAASNRYEALPETSFNPNDGITTNHDCRSENAPNYNYLVCANDSDDSIVSRWYIIEAKRTRQGYYKLALKRDIIADNLDKIMEAPMFVEKATVAFDDPAIFNSENMSFNEIKTKETLLKDGTESAWIALYFAQGLNEDITGSVSLKGDADIDLTTVSHTNWQYYNVDKSVKPSANALTIGTLVVQRPLGIFGAYNGKYVNTTVNEAWLSDDQVVSNDKAGYIPQSEKTKDADKLRAAIKANTYNYSGIIAQLDTENDWLANDEIEKFNNKTIAFSDGVYLCTVHKTVENFSKRNGDSSNPLSDEVVSILSTSARLSLDAAGVNYTGPFKYSFKVSAKLVHYVVQLTAQAGKNITYNYKISSTHRSTEDVPYDVVLLPYNSIIVKADQTWIGQTMLPNVSLLVAKDIIEKNKGANKLIDAQIVPYFPEPEKIIETPIPIGIKLNIHYETEGITYDKIVAQNNKIASFVWYAKKASFTNTIKANCGNTDVNPLHSVISKPLTIQDIKTVIETEKLRVCSPNYNGVFEFQPVKAGIYDSEIDFNIDCTYMPQTPYIHVNPVFKGRLYGQDFDDARGLICGGDFSMAQSSDAWDTYKAQNKNFQMAFNRQIESIELNNSVQKINDAFGAIGGTIQGAASGATAGFMSGGGPAGAVAGGVVGGISSAAGGVLDVINSEKLRKDNLDLTKDQFGYSLGNIKALPDSLVKLPAQTYNNKIWPFVELYTCTEEERNALKNKLKYNGMTVMRIGTLKDYVHKNESYIKGKLIRLDDADMDDHEVNVIADELNKGIYIKE